MVETKDLVKWGVSALGGIVAVSIVMLGLLAIFRDGEVAQTITAGLLQVIQLCVPGLTILLGVNQVGSAVVATTQAKQTQAAQPAPAAQESAL